MIFQWLCLQLSLLMKLFQEKVIKKNVTMCRLFQHLGLQVSWKLNKPKKVLCSFLIFFGFLVVFFGFFAVFLRMKLENPVKPSYSDYNCLFISFSSTSRAPSGFKCQKYTARLSIITYHLLTFSCGLTVFSLLILRKNFENWARSSFFKIFGTLKALFRIRMSSIDFHFKQPELEISAPLESNL